MRLRPSHQALAKASRYMIPYQWIDGWNARPNSSNAGNWIAIGSIWWRWIMELRIPLRARAYCARAVPGRWRPRPAGPTGSERFATQARVAPPPQVEHLDQHREAHRPVDVALGDVHVEAFQEQVGADQHDECERQHLHRWIGVDELAQRPRRQQHHRDRHQDR